MAEYRQPKSALVLLATVLVLAGIVVMSARTSAFHQPQHQPIDFFHSLHAGERKIPCGYCHRTTETAAFAGMPSTQLCISCHRVVLPNNPEIWKLRSFWELESAIPWKRTHDLPDHVYFSHEAHATANVACAECHGQVESMDRIQQVKPLTMGWCLDCHRQQDASTECWSCHR